MGNEFCGGDSREPPPREFDLERRLHLPVSPPLRISLVFLGQTVLEKVALVTQAKSIETIVGAVPRLSVSTVTVVAAEVAGHPLIVTVTV